ncbi:uncharacterized protein RB166_012316 [Leptodactylus fuscus]
MEVIYHHANESKLTFNVPKGEALHKVWSSLWEQCEAANERLEAHRTCFPKSNAKIMANAMKMLTVFQNEVKGQEANSRSADGGSSHEGQCDNCGLSKSKQKLLESNYERRGKMIEYLLSSSSGSPSVVVKGKQPPHETYGLSYESDDNDEPGGSKSNNNALKTTPYIQQRSDLHEKETPYKPNLTNSLVQLLPNFTKYDPMKDFFTNMSLFEDECTQHSLGSRESCLMMKLWLPSQMSVRLASPVARPAGGPQFWSNESHWGDRQDRLKALASLVTGEDDFGIDILEELKVTFQDDPWEFSRKFEQAYRLVMGIKGPSVPPALLKALVNKFTFLDCATRMAACKEKSVDGIINLVDKYRKTPCTKRTLTMVDQVSPTPYQRSARGDEKTTRLRTHPPQDTSGDAANHQNVRSFSSKRPEIDQTIYNRYEEDSAQQCTDCDPDPAKDQTKDVITQNQEM